MSGFWIALALILIAFSNGPGNHNLLGSAIIALNHYAETDK